MSATDILGEYAIPGDPEHARRLAAWFQSSAGQVDDCVSTLRVLQGHATSGIWTGTSAAAFVGQIGDLPNQLDKVSVSYLEASQALSQYENGLDDLQRRSAWVAEQLLEAEQQRQAAVNARQAASAGSPDAHALDARVHDAVGDVHYWQQQARALHDEFDALVSTAVGALDQASRDGIHNSVSTTFERYVVKDALDPVASYAYEQLIKPLVDFVEHPGLKTLSKLLGEVSLILGVLCLIPGLGELLMPVFLGVDFARLAVDGTLVAEGKGSWSDLAWDTVSVALDGISMYAFVHEGMAEKDAFLHQDGPVTEGEWARHGVSGVDVHPHVMTLTEMRSAVVDWAAQVRDVLHADVRSGLDYLTVPRAFDEGNPSLWTHLSYAADRWHTQRNLDKVFALHSPAVTYWHHVHTDLEIAHHLIDDHDDITHAGTSIGTLVVEQTQPSSP